MPAFAPTNSTPAAIRAAKIGTHDIVWAPGMPPQTCVVRHVRGEFVWVSPADAQDEPPVRCNRTASAMLLAGKYRTV